MGEAAECALLLLSVRLSLWLIKYRVVKTCGTMEVYLQAAQFLGKEIPLPWCRGLEGPRSRYGLLLQGIEPRLPSRLVHSLVPILTELTLQKEDVILDA